MCNVDRKFPLRKARSTYSLPEGMCQTSKYDYINEMNKTNSNHSISLKSDELSKDSKRSYSFIAKYKNNCKAMNSQPLSLVKVQFSDVFLDLIVDRIKLSDWIAMLKTISKDKSLHFISFRSKIRGQVIQEHINTEKKAQQVNKGSVLNTRYLINKIAESLGECLAHSKNFLCLQLQRIPLRGAGIQILGQGLKKTQSLQHLSLQYCDIGDDGCMVLSQTLRNVPTLITMDLSFCNISTAGAKHISDLIKFQEIARFGECWKQSLRYREVDHDQIQGLRRVTLNDNPDIGDVGLQYIIDVLMDDFWVRALDMQNCGITEDGATLVTRLIEINNEIGVIDLRRNSQMKSATVAKIIKTLSKKITEEKAEYVWLHLNDQVPPGSAMTTVGGCENNFWNRASRRSREISSNLSVASSTEQTSINKVKKWKASQKMLFKEDETSVCPTKHHDVSKRISEENLRNCNLKNIESLEYNRIDKDNKKEKISESHVSDESETGSCKSIKTCHYVEPYLELKKMEATENNLTKNIKDIFYDFIKLSSTKKREQFPNVNYQRRKNESDSD